MIPHDLLIAAIVCGFGLGVAALAYHQGREDGEARSARRIEQLLDDLDDATDTLRMLAARDRHPAGRELRIVRDDAS